ncbi:hypothetical protein VaNZ11_008446 [Volvox africanus]|uniref:Transmembrane protein n=1 Tax=Volvox africanus TaxID=51714 RepID=A0ABQ5S6A2_9CHLO|nr:hypothetical protein VaNZ11_008446 [Volvox africanus]
MERRNTNGMAFNSISCCILPLVCVGALLQSVLLTGVGFLKGAVVLVPVALLTIPSWVFATILHWPRAFVATYLTVAVTQRLGPNLRTLALVVLPVPLVAWPLATAIASVMFSLGVGFFWPLWATVALGSLLEADKLLSTAVLEPLDLAKGCALEVWKFNDLTYFTHLDELRRPYYGEPLDVSLVRLLIAAVLSLLCSLLGTLAVLLLGLIRLPFIVARALGEWMSLLGKCPAKLMCLWLPLWVLGIPLIPVVVLSLFFLVALGNAVYIGPTCGVVAYLSTTSRPAYRCFTWALLTALDVMYAHIYAMDEAAVRLTGLGSSSLLPLPSQRIDGLRMPYTGSGVSSTAHTDAAAPSAQSSSPKEQAWATFEDICAVSVERAVMWGWVPRADLADSEAYLFIGLPALALLQLLADAAAAPSGWMPAEAASDRTEAAAPPADVGVGPGRAGEMEGTGAGEVDGGGDVVLVGRSGSLEDIEAGAEARSSRELRKGGGEDAEVEVLLGGSVIVYDDDDYDGGSQEVDAEVPRSGSIITYENEETIEGEVYGEGSAREGGRGRKNVGDAGVACEGQLQSSTVVLPLPPPATAATAVVTEAAASLEPAMAVTSPSSPPAQPNTSDADANAGYRSLSLDQPTPLSFGPGSASRATANAAASADAPAGSESSAVSATEPGEPCVCLPLGNHPLDSADALVLLEELAEQVLTADIGFSSAANPVRLHRSLVALQASPLELRYMACHTVLLGDPRLTDLVPLFVTTATATATATTGPGTAHARPSTAAAACTAAAGGGGGDPGHKGHTLSAAGGGGGGSHSRRVSRWSLNGGGGGGGGGGTVNVASSSHSRPGSSSNVPLGGSTAAAAAAPRLDSGGAGIRFLALFSRDTNGSTGAGGGGGGTSAPNSPQLAVVARTAELAEVPEPPVRLVSGMQHRHLTQQRRRSSSLGCSAAASAGNAVAKVPELPSMQSCPAAAAAAVNSRVSSSVASCLSTPELLGEYEGGHLDAGPRRQPHSGSAAAAVLVRLTDWNGHAAPSEAAHSQPRSGTTTPISSPFANLSPSILPAQSPPGSNPAAPPQPNQTPTGVVSADWPPKDHSAQSTLQLRILVPQVGGAAATTHGSGGGQAASTLPPPHSQPSGHRWPFGKGHRRTQSQPVGAPAACNGGALVPPSPRSVPGGAESAATVVVAAASRPATAAGITTLNVLGYHPARISESGGGGSSSKEAETDMEAVDPAVAAATAAAAAGALLVTPQRLAQLHAFTAAVQSVATALSKKQRMKEIMSRLLIKYGTCGSLHGEDQGGGQLVAVVVAAGTAA